MNSYESEWTFLSNSAHVLVCLAQNPRALLREVADRVGITERTAMRLITQLEQAGVLKREKQGRRNFYQIMTTVHLRHPLEAHCTIDDLLGIVLRPVGDSHLHQPVNSNTMARKTEAKQTQKQQKPKETQ